ncbi:MAG: winged helix-turn-helix transcriptional regulator [Candidatus Accumulibacter sp.]|uniref:winged helix-turn-helix transcriptional regulator n=1 Tax=Accumulibacter sp. TaxID=2053492 RepID=UPI002590C546|nr:winged helix-turn-helix transcriptional regulator [Accumulibacter sp.]MBK8113580.1 winged helix-turn-helix transcriptional regulator [Accumulibacter sp.]
MISPNPASPNGTRARILILLTKNGPMTTAEIAEALGLTPKQVRDNSNQARHENLIASGRDDVTGTLAYSITPAGRDWVKALLSLGKPLAQDMTMLPKADSGTSEEASPDADIGI